MSNREPPDPRSALGSAGASAAVVSAGSTGASSVSASGARVVVRLDVEQRAARRHLGLRLGGLRPGSGSAFGSGSARGRSSASMSNSEPPDGFGSAGFSSSGSGSAFASGSASSSPRSNSEPPDEAGFAGSGSSASSAASSAGVSKSDEPPEDFAAGPTSLVSVTVSSVWVSSPGSGSARVSSGRSFSAVADARPSRVRGGWPARP